MVDKSKKRSIILKSNKDVKNNKNGLSRFPNFIIPPRFGFEVRKVEESLKKLNDILFAKIVLSKDKNIKEIHIVAKVSSNPKIITRDIESLLLEKYNIEVDNRKIVITQVEEMVSSQVEEIVSSLEKYNTEVEARAKDKDIKNIYMVGTVKNYKSIQKVLAEMKKEIKETSQKIVSLDNNIKELTKKNIDQKIAEIEFKIDLLSYSKIKILSLLEKILASTKEPAGYDLPVPYIISLSLSAATFAFCGVSLYVNIFNSIRLFDPYISLFWFFGSIGIGLMSLKGIFDWSNK